MPRVNRKPSPPPSPSTSQLTGNNKPLPDAVTRTDNQKYGVYLDSANVDKKTGASLFVNTNVPPPKFQGIGNETQSPTTYAHGTDTFERYQFQKGVKDCAHNAEEVQHGKPLLPPAKHADNEFTLASKEKVTGQVFGYSHEDNIEVSKQARKTNPNAVNHNANPQPGESYGIIRQHEPRNGQSPFHFAPVVARDGNQTITAEQTAGTSDAKSRNTYPTMDVYRVGDNQDSFHNRYANKDGYGKDAITVTTQKWGPQTLRENDPKPDATEPLSKKQRTE
ncbi:hypothetical protein JQX13_51280 [Archangium violaceum]|uniref:hypothetical protein n=1 Tax=Archangium violaceum TaxID=83451 RepID=UPI00193BCCED|nr:hypothetical protein [Archangium violaceum]QRK08225.1 hypothetical protein JQX13_51280 [Archangium violaceum]